MTNKRFPKTAEHRIGSVMLWREWSADFSGDYTIYNALYARGFRAFQLFLIGHSDAYLRDARRWADDQTDGDVEISGLLAFIEPGLDGACPISADSTKRQAAGDQLKATFDKCRIVRATGIHGPMFQGLMNEHLGDIPADQQKVHCLEFLRYADGLAKSASLPIGFEVLNMHEYPPPGPTTLDRANMLFAAAEASEWIRHLLDTCHQGQGEFSTATAWDEYGARGSCIHFSDYGRTTLGREQAFRPEIFDLLVRCQFPLTIYVEGVGDDVSPFIRKALHVNRLPGRSGLEVQTDAMDFIERKFKAAQRRVRERSNTNLQFKSH